MSRSHSHFAAYCNADVISGATVEQVDPGVLVNLGNSRCSCFCVMRPAHFVMVNKNNDDDEQPIAESMALSGHLVLLSDLEITL